MSSPRLGHKASENRVARVFPAADLAGVQTVTTARSRS